MLKNNPVKKEQERHLHPESMLRQLRRGIGALLGYENSHFCCLLRCVLTKYCIFTENGKFNNKYDN